MIPAGTVVDPFFQPHAWFHFSAAAASLGTGIPTAYTHKLLPFPLQLVSQKARKHTPAIIRNTFSKVQSPAHLLHIQILNAYDIVGIGYLPRSLMQEVLSLMNHMAVKPRHLRNGGSPFHNG